MSKPSTATRRLRKLKRRRDYLKRVINRDEGNSHDVAEFAALAWAIQVIEANWESARHTSG